MKPKINKNKKIINYFISAIVSKIPNNVNNRQRNLKINYSNKDTELFSFSQTY